MWARSLQCGERARQRVEDFIRQGGPEKVTSWTNHYNRSDQRCYARVNVMNGERAGVYLYATPSNEDWVGWTWTGNGRDLPDTG